MMRSKRHTGAANPAPGIVGDGLRSRWRYLPRLLSLLWGLGPRDVVLLSLFSVAGGLLPVISLMVLQRLVDSTVAAITLQGSLVPPLLWAAGLFLANVLYAFCDFWENGWLGFGRSIRERIRAQAQAQVLAKASRLSLEAFEQPELYDQLHRAQQGIDTRLLNLVRCLLPMGADLLAVIGLSVYVGSANWLFPLILALGLLPLSAVHARNLRQRHSLERKHTPAERILQYLGDLMIGRQAAAEIRLFGLQEHLLERRQWLFLQLRNARLTQARAHVRSSMLSMSGEQLTYGVVVVGVVALIARGNLSVGYFAAYWAAAERFRNSLSFLFWSGTTLDNDLRYIRDLFDYLDVPEESEPRREATRRREGRPEPAALPPVGGAHVSSRKAAPLIRFERVSFTYKGSDHAVLDGIDLEIRPGERIALVGENGAGKTTLARLLLGLYHPTGGRITVNGIDLREIEPRLWRAGAAAVFQDYVRFELSACENIGFGDLSRLHEQPAIAAAAAKSGADPVLARLPAGYSTVLGKAYDEHGQDLSMGQWQKLAIARAYLRDASVLVLDEPTAALDAKAEVEVYQQFRDLSQGKSVLLISHRLGAARLADRIVVLSAGRILEEGRHADLLKRNGRYAEMHSIQAHWYQ